MTYRGDQPLKKRSQRVHKSIHHFRQPREPSLFPIHVVLVENRNRPCYELSFRPVRSHNLRSPVHLDREKKLVPREIVNAETGCCVPVFAANEEREGHPTAHHSSSAFITQSIKKGPKEIKQNGSTLARGHADIEQSDQSPVGSFLHGAGVNDAE